MDRHYNYFNFIIGKAYKNQIASMITRTQANTFIHEKEHHTKAT